MIKKALFTKFSASQNYYFTKDINNILSGQRTGAVIKFKDLQSWDEQDEFLKRAYKMSEYPTKISMLTEYYKFHKDIPRMFMLPTTHALNKYHDKQRRLEYLRITKMLQIQEDGDQADQKNSIKIQKKPHYVPTTQEKFLAELDEESELKKGKQVNASTNTIQELNFKLNEIVNKSRDTFYLDIEERSVGNLSNFINYLKQNSNNLTPFSVEHQMNKKDCNVVKRQNPHLPKPQKNIQSRPKPLTTDINIDQTLKKFFNKCPKNDNKITQNDIKNSQQNDNKYSKNSVEKAQITQNLQEARNMQKQRDLLNVKKNTQKEENQSQQIPNAVEPIINKNLNLNVNNNSIKNMDDIPSIYGILWQHQQQQNALKTARELTQSVQFGKSNQNSQYQAFKNRKNSLQGHTEQSPKKDKIQLKNEFLIFKDLIKSQNTTQTLKSNKLTKNRANSSSVKRSDYSKSQQTINKVDKIDKAEKSQIKQKAQLDQRKIHEKLIQLGLTKKISFDLQYKGNSTSREPVRVHPNKSKQQSKLKSTQHTRMHSSTSHSRVCSAGNGCFISSISSKIQQEMENELQNKKSEKLKTLQDQILYQKQQTIQDIIKNQTKNDIKNLYGKYFFKFFFVFILISHIKNSLEHNKMLKTMRQL